MDNTLRVWDIRPYAPADRCVKVFSGHQHNFEKVTSIFFTYLFLFFLIFLLSFLSYYTKIFLGFSQIFFKQFFCQFWIIFFHFSPVSFDLFAFFFGFSSTLLDWKFFFSSPHFLLTDCVFARRICWGALGPRTVKKFLLGRPIDFCTFGTRRHVEYCISYRVTMEA